MNIVKNLLDFLDRTNFLFIKTAFERVIDEPWRIIIMLLFIVVVSRTCYKLRDDCNYDWVLRIRDKRISQVRKKHLVTYGCYENQAPVIQVLTDAGSKKISCMKERYELIAVNIYNIWNFIRYFSLIFIYLLVFAI